MFKWLETWWANKRMELVKSENSGKKVIDLNVMYSCNIIQINYFEYQMSTLKIHFSSVSPKKKNCLFAFSFARRMPPL